VVRCRRRRRWLVAMARAKLLAAVGDEPRDELCCVLCAVFCCVLCCGVCVCVCALCCGVLYSVLYVSAGQVKLSAKSVPRNLATGQTSPASVCVCFSRRRTDDWASRGLGSGWGQDEGFGSNPTSKEREEATAHRLQRQRSVASVCRGGTAAMHRHREKKNKKTATRPRQHYH
jgi:hypothetical protein